MTNKVVVQKTVGGISIRGEASSDRHYISMQELLNIATAAADNHTVEGQGGVNVTVTMSGPDAPATPKDHDHWGRAEPMFTPAPGEDIRYADPSSRPRGCHAGSITPAAKVEAEQTAKKAKESQRAAVMAQYKEKLHNASLGYEYNNNGAKLAIAEVIRVACFTHENFIHAMDKDKDVYNVLRSNMATLQTTVMERDQEIADLLQQIDKLHRDMTKLNEVMMNNEDMYILNSNALNKQVEDYRCRLKSINQHIEAIKQVS